MRMAWVARAECGHIVSAHADDDSHKGNAASLRWVVKESPKDATYDRVTAEQVRTEGICPGHSRRPLAT